jgi:hypothetical protein
MEDQEEVPDMLAQRGIAVEEAVAMYEDGKLDDAFPGIERTDIDAYLAPTHWNGTYPISSSFCEFGMHTNKIKLRPQPSPNGFVFLADHVGDLMLVVLSKHFRRRIHVHHVEAVQILPYSDEWEPAFEAPIHLAYFQNHYDGVTPPVVVGDDVEAARALSNMA